jgi:hypothetical protein
VGDLQAQRPNQTMAFFGMLLARPLVIFDLDRSRTVCFSESSLITLDRILLFMSIAHNMSEQYI